MEGICDTGCKYLGTGSRSPYSFVAIFMHLIANILSDTIEFTQIPTIYLGGKAHESASFALYRIEALIQAASLSKYTATSVAPMHKLHTVLLANFACFCSQVSYTAPTQIIHFTLAKHSLSQTKPAPSFQLKS